MRPDKLYIYEINGKVQPEKSLMGENYIGCWNEAGHSYLFFSRQGMGFVDEILKEDGNLVLTGETEMKYEEWEPADTFKPFRIPPLSFIPAWMEPENDGLVPVRIDPGVVFGTGTHSTTFMCIELLVEMTEKESVKTLLDLGTGTGILAVSAAALGAEKVIAVDNNNLAVETARENVRLNGFEKVIDCITGDASDYMETPADCVMANIIIWELAGMFGAGRKPAGRYYIVSGIREGEAEEAVDIFSAHKLRVVKKKYENSWCSMLLENRGV